MTSIGRFFVKHGNAINIQLMNLYHMTVCNLVIINVTKGRGASKVFATCVLKSDQCHNEPVEALLPGPHLWPWKH